MLAFARLADELTDLELGAPAPHTGQYKACVGPLPACDGPVRAFPTPHTWSIAHSAVARRRPAGRRADCSL